MSTLLSALPSLTIASIPICPQFPIDSNVNANLKDLEAVVEVQSLDCKCCHSTIQSQNYPNLAKAVKEVFKVSLAGIWGWFIYGCWCTSSEAVAVDLELTDLAPELTAFKEMIEVAASSHLPD